ncbi:hypothetical protein AAY72_01580 [Alishewanella sp. WH16-1]|uniref:hypothetical protein n=1 Tax=Alishewanella sp. WH16-1 TaxID=1651088 RepID=UPI0007100B32|nr:hypothetical protein [Alishewanella sp. WH16-1]KRS22830.1 hypothetical protein AAY72_01580 [Alishewanella sp. WH16-1]
MSDYFDSFKLFLYERVSNPLVTAFAFSWLIFNYAFFLMAFSGDDAAIKLTMISSYYESPDWIGISNLWGRGVFYPLASALSYIFVLPWITKKVVKYHYEHSTDIKNIKSRAEGEILVTNKKASEFKAQYEVAEAKIDELMSKNKSDQKAHQEQLNLANGTIQKQLKSISEKDYEIENLKKKLIKLELDLSKSSKDIDDLQTLIKNHEFEKNLIDEELKSVKGELEKARLSSNGAYLSNNLTLQQGALHAASIAQQYQSHINSLNKLKSGDAYTKFENEESFGKSTRSTEDDKKK